MEGVTKRQGGFGLRAQSCRERRGPRKTPGVLVSKPKESSDLTLVATFVKEEADATLGITHLPLRGSNGYSKSSSEMTTEMDGGVFLADNGQKG